MTKLFFALVIFGSSAFAWPQTDGPGARPTVEEVPAQAERVPPETNLMAEMLVSIDAGNARTGDVVTAKVRGGTPGARQTLLPDGATLIGYVKDVRGRTKEQPESNLSVCFDKARLKDGAEVQVNLMLYHLARTEVIMVSRPTDNGLSPNRSIDRMAPPNSRDPNQRVPMGVPERNPGSYSPSVRPSTGAQRGSTTAVPPAPSGLEGVRLAAVRQHKGSFAVLTSDARNVKVKKHDLVFFQIIQD